MNYIVLSIHEIHAERILLKKKFYELRKVLPKEPFSKVFLYQTGGKGLVGAFDVGKVYKKDVENLWETVGEKATPKNRFFTYFENRDFGCAIQVKKPIRFRTNIDKDVLKKEEPKFSAPQSFLVIRPGDRLFRTLDNIYSREVKKKSPSEGLLHRKKISLEA